MRSLASRNTAPRTQSQLVAGRQKGEYDMIATYASYIWTCYGITAAVLILNVWLARRSHLNELKATQRRQQMQAEKV